MQRKIIGNVLIVQLKEIHQLEGKKNVIQVVCVHKEDVMIYIMITLILTVHSGDYDS
jgi:hypothetical protein